MTSFNSSFYIKDVNYYSWISILVSMINIRYCLLFDFFPANLPFPKSLRIMKWKYIIIDEWWHYIDKKY